MAAFVICHSASAADYFVNPRGANGTYTTVQAALDAVNGESEWNRANVYIAPGTYRELVTIAKPYVTLVGQGSSAASTTISANPVHTRTAGWNPVVMINNTATAFMARNLTVENSTADRNQAAALAVYSGADRAIFEDVRFLGYQDTLLVDQMSRQYVRSSFITGDTDFIFGNATAVFDHCTIESTDRGFITAANTRRVTANGLIFLDSTLVKGVDRNPSVDDRTTAADHSVFLGRPWGWFNPDQMPSVVFIRTRMGSQIAPAGWDPWNETGNPSVDPSADRDPRTRLSEFGSMDLNGYPLPDSDRDGTPDGRVRWADAMSAEQAANYTLDHIFGEPEFWTSATQPETSGRPYERQGDPWDPSMQLARLPRPGPANPSRAVNLSTRLRVGTGENVMISGFIVNGTASKNVILRALGPSLAQAGIGDVLVNPRLELRRADSSLVAANDDWKEDATQRELIKASGVPPVNDAEAALVAALEPGSYTVIVSGVDGSKGLAVAEIYDLDANAGAALANVSTRGFVATGNDVMIAGFILGGSNAGAKVIVRASGPSLQQAGVGSALANPTLELHNGNGSLIAFNNDWKEEDQASVEGTGIPPAVDQESAIVVTLPHGNYTAIVAGKDGTAGVALIEVYVLP